MDGIVHRLGDILRNDPKSMKRAMLAFSKSENFWKRRASIICQLDFKTDLHPDLLYRAIAPSMDSKDFFLPYFDALGATT